MGLCSPSPAIALIQSMRLPRNLSTASDLDCGRNGQTSHAGADSTTIKVKGRTSSAVMRTGDQRNEGRGKITTIAPIALGGLAHPHGGWVIMRRTVDSCT